MVKKIIAILLIAAFVIASTVVTASGLSRRVAYSESHKSISSVDGNLDYKETSFNFNDL